MQVAIDSAKRTFEVDVTNEIKRIKEEINVKDNGYPSFWSVIRKGFDYKKINHMLHSPMGYLCGIQNTKIRSKTPTLPMSDFFIQHELDMNRKVSKRVEEWIEKYTGDLMACVIDDVEDVMYNSESFLLQAEFDEMVKDIRQLSISKKYAGLFSWLLNRAFAITPQVKGQMSVMNSKTARNKSILLKTLYAVNPEVLLSCFSSTGHKCDSKSSKAAQILDFNHYTKVDERRETATACS